MLNTADLFAGCGGMSLGFEKAGFDICAAFDNWLPAIKVYSDNFDHPIFDMDLWSSEIEPVLRDYAPQVIIGGPPCQDFSIAGHQNTNILRLNLTLRFADLICGAKPQFFVMENVYNIEKKPVLAKAKNLLKKNGYGLTSAIIDASFVGVPQKRKRFFLIGSMGEKDNFLLERIKENQSGRRTTVFDYLQNEFEIENFYIHPRNYKRRGVFSIHEPCSTIRGTNRPISKNYQRHRGDTASIDQGVRTLNVRERSRIQTFPRDFVLNGTKTDLNQVIGNAVPVNLAYFVAKCLSDHIHCSSENSS